VELAIAMLAFALPIAVVAIRVFASPFTISAYPTFVELMDQLMVVHLVEC
jgi:hypothetical protein